jgi:hypothetical protein
MTVRDSIKKTVAAAGRERVDGGSPMSILMAMPSTMLRGLRLSVVEGLRARPFIPYRCGK